MDTISIEKPNNIDNVINISNPTDTSDLSEKEYNLIIQNMISDYLKGTESPNINEILEKAEGKKEVEGELTKTHIQLVQAMIKDYYQSIGGNLENLAMQKGITIKDGELSSLEKETLGVIIQDYCMGIKTLLNKENN